MVSKVGEGGGPSIESREKYKKMEKMVLGKIKFSSFLHESSETELRYYALSNLRMKYFHLSFKDYKAIAHMAMHADGYQVRTRDPQILDRWELNTFSEEIFNTYSARL